MHKGIIAERKARDKERKSKNKSEKEKERRSKSVNHVGTSMNAVRLPKGPSRGNPRGNPRGPLREPPILPSRVQSMDDVKKKRPPPKRLSRKAKSLPIPFVQMSPPSPQTYGRISPNLFHPEGSLFKRYTGKEPHPSDLRNPNLTRRFRRMSRRFIWAEEPDVELKVEPKTDPRNV